MRYWVLSLLILNLFSLNVFAKTESEKFVAVYQDKKTGLSWSKRIPGNYSNGCANEDGEYAEKFCSTEKGPDGSPLVKVKHSNAAKACAKMGARLPTKKEYESLIRDFDFVETEVTPRLTPAGVDQMDFVFDDMYSEEVTNSWFWTSSIIEGRDSLAIHFYGNEIGHLGFNQRSVSSMSVRCVMSPKKK